MKKHHFRFVGILAFLSLCACSSTAHAQGTTFANFSQGTTGNQFTFTNNGTSSTFTSTQNVSFLYIIANDTGLVNVSIPAVLTLTGTVDGTASGTGRSGTSFDQFLKNISVQFTAVTPINGKTDLLSYSGGLSESGDISGRYGGATVSLTEDTGLGDVILFSSDFLDFSRATDENAQYSFTSVTPTLGQNANGFLNTFMASGSGTFASTPAPAQFTPEPSALSALAIGGLGLCCLGSVTFLKKKSVLNLN